MSSCEHNLDVYIAYHLFLDGIKVFSFIILLLISISTDEVSRYDDFILILDIK